MNKEIALSLAFVVAFSFSICGQTARRPNAARKIPRTIRVLDNLTPATVCYERPADAISETFTGEIASRFFYPTERILASFVVRGKNGEEVDLEINDRYLKRKNPARLKEIDDFLHVGRQVKVWAYACGKTHWAYKVRAF